MDLKQYNNINNNSEDRDVNNDNDHEKSFICNSEVDNNHNTKCFALSEKVKVLSRRALNTTSSVYKISDPDIQQLIYWYQII